MSAPTRRLCPSWAKEELTETQLDWARGLERYWQRKPPLRQTFCETCLGTGHLESPYGWLECPDCLGRRCNPHCPRCGEKVTKKWSRDVRAWEIQVCCTHCGWED